MPCNFCDSLPQQLRSILSYLTDERVIKWRVEGSISTTSINIEFLHLNDTGNGDVQQQRPTEVSVCQDKIIGISEDRSKTEVKKGKSLKAKQQRNPQAQSQKRRRDTSVGSDTEIAASSCAMLPTEPRNFRGIATLDRDSNGNSLHSQLPPTEPRSVELFIQDMDNDLVEADGAIAQVGRISLANCDIRGVPLKVCSYASLRVLYLTGNKLFDLPRDLGRLRVLEQLHLGMNFFRDVPEAVFDLSELRILNLSHNQLHTKGIGEINKLSKLEELVLDGNKLDALPRAIFGLENLVHLDASHNPITFLPKDVQKLKKLSYLRLKMCRLQALPTEIGSLPLLETICVSENMITVVPGKEMTRMRRLRTICLHSNRLDVKEEGIRDLVTSKDVRLGENIKTKLDNVCCGGCQKKPATDSDVLIFHSGTEAAEKIVNEEVLPLLEQELGLEAIVDFRDFKVGKPESAEWSEYMKSCRKLLFVLTDDFGTGPQRNENKLHIDQAVQFIQKCKDEHSHGHGGRQDSGSKIIPLLWYMDPDNMPERLRSFVYIRREDQYFRKRLEEAFSIKT